MERKINYTLIGCSLSLINVALIDTRFTIVGIGFGLLASVFLIKALLIRK
jgi:hypothetical protein